MGKFELTSKCTGCAACSNACSQNAITMELDENGFYKPFIDEAKCINCGLCSKICPVEQPKYENKEAPSCYAFMASDEVRARSSSGGVFEVLADEMLKQGGSVFGVAHRDDFTTEHICIEKKSELGKLRGSKYVMSDIGFIYREVREKLKKGSKVLFSGTPCQIAGLNAFLGNQKESEKLITVDLICHGIPSVKAFKKYIADVHGKRPLKYVGYKEKQYGWHASMTIDFADGDRYNEPCEKDVYFWSYLSGVNKNAACGACPFARIPRQGDITIGDYWGIANYKPELNDGKGTSVVLLNNDKGRSFFEKVQNKAKLCEETPLEPAIKGNSNLVTSPKTHVSRNQFFKNLSSRRFGELAPWSYATERYDVGIVGIPTFVNFGGALTYFSLFSLLSDKGYSVCSISRPRSCGRPPIMPDVVYEQNPYPPNALKLEFKDKEAMREMNNVCETFLVGSDQLFNADLYYKFGEMITLDWVSDNHRKVAYAASFGHSVFWGREELRAKMAHYMQKFDAFSVRETDGVPLAKNTFGVDAEWVLDPVFLCDKKHYERLAENTANKSGKPHIFSYILDPDEKKNEILSYCHKKLHLDVELFSEMLFKPTEETLKAEQKRFNFPLRQARIEERLYSLIHADYIVTDSFHGVCFAIIFNKPFVAILNANRGATRFLTILGKLGLTERLVTTLEEAKEVLKKEVDFTMVNQLLQEERERCISWLLEAISPKEEVKKAFSDVDILNQKLDAQNKVNRRYEMKMNALMNGKLYCMVSDIGQYLDMIRENKEELQVLISVRDTPGFQITDSIDEKLRNLGCRISLKDKHWQSYVCVINNGTVMFEQISKNEERVAYIGNLEDRTYKVVSRSYRKGDVSAIQIDGIEYSENRRGLNIVLYDTNQKAVIDSVCFDTHMENAPCYREGKHCNTVLPRMNNIQSVLEQKVAPTQPEVKVTPMVPMMNQAIESSNIKKTNETLLHNAMVIATVGGSSFDYFIDKGIKNVDIYGEDLLVSFLYEQAYYKNIEIRHMFGREKKELEVRFPRTGRIVVEDIASVDLKSLELPIIVADIAIPTELLEYKKNGNMVYRVGQLNLYSHLKRFLLDPLLQYAKNYSELKLAILAMPTIHEIANKSELEEDIAKNYPKHDKERVNRQVFEANGWDSDYRNEVCAPIEVSKGRQVTLVDKTSKYVNVVNGCRVTTDIPVDFTNTIYLFGNSLCYGVGTSDEYTIGSVLQREVNSKAELSNNYAVLNCCNGGSLNAKQMMEAVKYHMPQNGDVIVLIMDGFDELTKDIYGQKFIWCEGKKVLDRPNNLGEIYWDRNHFNSKGYEACGQYLAKELLNHRALCDRKTLKKINGVRGIPVFETVFTDIENKELDDYVKSLASVRRKDANGKIGSIVMNCNPFTLGHRYLIETAAEKCDVLYIFVVEENRSVFSFEDRFELVKKGVRDLKNVVVLPSGKFIISQTTFSAYFLKEENKDAVIDPSEDVSIFAAKIAPALGIQIRFAGEEPLDPITNQYNATMKRILPKYGIAFEVIKRKEESGEPISASRVRRLLKERQFDEIKNIVPGTTYEYLYNRYKNSKRVLVLGGTRFMGLRLVERLIEKNWFVTIATRGLHKDPFGKNVERIKLDRLDEQTVIQELEGKYFDVVIDTSAYASNAVKNVLSHIACGYYLQVSSVAVYGKHHLDLKETELRSEEVELRWVNEEKNYGLGKRYAEAAITQAFPKQKHAIVRIPFVVETENLDNKELNMRLFFYVEKIMKQIPMKIDNLDYCCSFVRTNEEAEFLEYLAKNDIEGIYNFSSKGYITIKEIISYIEKMSGKKAIISEDGVQHPFRSEHFGYSGYSFDLSNAKSTGFKLYSLKNWLYDLLDEYIKMFKEK